ncbi:hypothetical protein F4820DRAFT_229009 [Hypoxylon rubiginosum]|uniref:Uncharacterized protein n=1 Tax=Hypoxylon rubiginosum TaxID=110542 RepID=A0ACB9Z7N6_9PEZI|nr:hypothetical protein F4820DRAFT_229009 [Hypoxylon rubiginosum]
MDIDDTDYAPQADSSDNEPFRSGETAPRKRHRRTADPSSYVPPLKRRKGTLHPKYITLLNGEIADASAGIVKDPEDSVHSVLRHSQVGAVVWTAAEKQAYFSALGRLGRDDSAGIATRIGTTKSALEVRQYTALLEEADRARRSDGDRVRRAPRAVDIPAAVELGTELCLALEAAADDVSLRQEMHEARLEQKRWASGRWLVTPSLVPVLEHQLRQPKRRQELLARMPFAELFRLDAWPRLSARIFMNSAVVPDGNWRCVSEEPPAVRATALADFYALALSVTRRLVAASLFVAQSRIRAKQVGDRRRDHRVRPFVRAKDVQAALASAGLKEGSREFWARAARRLRLDVYDDYDSQSEVSSGAEEEEEGKKEEESSSSVPEAREQSNEDTDINDPDFENDENEEDILDQDHETDTVFEPDIMSYDEVEAALGFPTPHSSRPPTPSYRILPDVSSTSSESESDDSDQDLPQPEAASNPDPDVPMEGELKDDPDDDDLNSDDNSDADPDAVEIDPDLVAQDLAEATRHSSLYDADTARARQAISRAIQAELQLEVQADLSDGRASAREEARLWGLLRRGDDYHREEEKKGRLSRSGMYQPGLEGGLEADGGNDWREHTEYYGEWEFDRRAVGA